MGRGDGDDEFSTIAALEQWVTDDAPLSGQDDPVGQALDHVCGWRVQTLARAFAELRAGETPWVALNEFFHEWWGYSVRHRTGLVETPIAVRRPTDVRPNDSPDLWRWAVFCAAAAEYLCAHASLPPPTWAQDPIYVLPEPWYGFGAISLTGRRAPDIKERLERTTPQALRRRGIVGGERVFDNKYETAAEAQARHARDGGDGGDGEQ